MYGTTRPFPRKRRGPRWWQIPLLPVTFPLSLLVVVLGWLRGRKTWKLLVAFTVIWVAYGQLTVMIDGTSGHGPRRTWLTASNPRRVLAKTPYTKGPVYVDPYWGCFPRPGVIGNFGSWPLGKPFVFVLSCDARLGQEMLIRVGLPRQGLWLVRQYELSLADYYLDGRLGRSYLWLGLFELLEIVLFVPWLAAWLCVAVARHLQVGWR